MFFSSLVSCFVMKSHHNFTAGTFISPLSIFFVIFFFVFLISFIIFLCLLPFLFSVLSMFLSTFLTTPITEFSIISKFYIWVRLFTPTTFSLILFLHTNYTHYPFKCSWVNFLNIFCNFFIMKQSKILTFSRFGFQTIFMLSGDTSV